MLPDLGRLRLEYASVPTSGADGGPDGTPPSGGSGPAARAVGNTEDVLRMIIDKARRDGLDDVPPSKRVHTTVTMFISKNLSRFADRPEIKLVYILNGPELYPRDAEPDKIDDIATDLRPKIVNALAKTLSANGPSCAPPEQAFTFDTLLTTSTVAIGKRPLTEPYSNKEIILECALSSIPYTSQASLEAECLYTKLYGDETDYIDHIEFAVELTNNMLAALGMIGYEETWNTVQRQAGELILRGNESNRTDGTKIFLEANLDSVRWQDVPVNELPNAPPNKYFLQVLESVPA